MTGNPLIFLDGCENTFHIYTGQCEILIIFAVDIIHVN